MTAARDPKSIPEPEVQTYDAPEFSTATVFTGGVNSAPSSRAAKSELKAESSERVLRALVGPDEPAVQTYGRDELASQTVFTINIPSVTSSRTTKSGFARVSARRTVRALAPR